MFMSGEEKKREGILFHPVLSFLVPLSVLSVSPTHDTPWLVVSTLRKRIFVLFLSGSCDPRRFTDPFVFPSRAMTVPSLVSREKGKAKGRHRTIDRERNRKNDIKIQLRNTFHTREERMCVCVLLHQHISSGRTPLSSCCLSF